MAELETKDQLAPKYKKGGSLEIAEFVEKQRLETALFTMYDTVFSSDSAQYRQVQTSWVRHWRQH